MANRLRRRTSDQTVLGSNPAMAAALSPWTRLFTPIVPRRSLHISFYKSYYFLHCGSVLTVADSRTQKLNSDKFDQ